MQIIVQLFLFSTYPNVNENVILSSCKIGSTNFIGAKNLDHEKSEVFKGLGRITNVFTQEYTLQYEHTINMVYIKIHYRWHK